MATAQHMMTSSWWCAATVGRLWSHRLLRSIVSDGMAPTASSTVRHPTALLTDPNRGDPPPNTAAPVRVKTAGTRGLDPHDSHLILPTTDVPNLSVRDPGEKEWSAVYLDLMHPLFIPVSSCLYFSLQQVDKVSHGTPSSPPHLPTPPKKTPPSAEKPIQKSLDSQSHLHGPKTYSRTYRKVLSMYLMQPILLFVLSKSSFNSVGSVKLFKWSI